MDKNGLVYTIIFSFLVTFGFVFLLALANEGTRTIVEENAKVADYQAVLTALGMEYEVGNNQDIIQKYQQVSDVTDTYGSSDGSTLYRAEVENQERYALRTQGSGLWGTIELVLGFDSSLRTFSGLEIISHNETPGLGGRIDESWFKEQFVNQQIPGESRLSFKQGTGSGDPNKNDSGVDAITGATRTSESMDTIINRAIDRMRQILGGKS
ncbi:FMN-binding protein [Spirochaeta lutea]|uniref:FMN-binding domain-containing protein n=1 Tax=Spirochaeta lutea TaxID=1480694 RepID=A0A098QZM7_9SPIO|nr:FMN-binding protein [Spirochaeta lutea]KGE73169.1 hypothetical protein DC28_05170 [Spirochaeta lutea]